MSTPAATNDAASWSFSVPLDSHAMRDAGASLSNRYQSASPFPHIVLDGMFSTDLLQSVAKEFPSPSDGAWRRNNTQDELKLACDEWHRMGPSTRALVAELNSGPFVEFLEAMTGVQHLIVDPHLVGGGLHMIQRGGRLGVHADFNRHRGLQVERRLNALLYLNENWDEAWGGSLELWDARMERAQVAVAPVFNRLVVFSTNRRSYHGHPAELTCPPDVFRRSIALYYYSVDRPPGDDDFGHTTIFRSPRGTPRSVRMRLERMRNAALRFVPPVVFDVGRAIRRRVER